MNPDQYPRRILLCVAGLSPQIVTETLYALTVIGEPAALNDSLADAGHPLIAARRAEGIPKEFFEERTSKLKRELSRALGEPMAARYTPQRQGSQRLAGHALGLEPRQIRFARLDKIESAIRNRST